MIPLRPALSTQIDELDRLAPTRRDAMQISREQGEILAGIAVMARAKLVVEVGTSYGFSGLWWCAALNLTGGHLHTMDILEKKYAAAQETFTAAGVSARVTQHLGSAHDILPTMPGEIDLAFIDADKPSTRAYFDLLWPKVRVGGAILTDNTISHASEMAAFVAHVRARADAHSVQLNTRSGVEWTIKLS